jgi:hypothetical protein
LGDTVAKRFTDSEKWRKPWFRALGAEARVVWIYLTDNCDHAGLWPAAFDLLTFDTGVSVTPEKLSEWFGDKIIKLADAKYFLPGFIEFQYGKLKPDSKPHMSVIKMLEKHAIDPVNLTLGKQSPKGMRTIKDKDKNKDQAKEKEKEPAEILFDLWNERRGGLALAHSLTPKRIASANAQLEKYPSVVHWADVLDRWKVSKFCLEQWRPTFDDWLNESKRIATLEGRYDNRADQATIGAGSMRGA